MRPTPPEELSALRSVLNRVIDATFDDDYIRGQLRHVSDGMAALASDWPVAAARLLAENEATEAFLLELAATSGAGSKELAAFAGDPTDLAALNERHQLLRGLVAEAIRDLDRAEDGDITITARRTVRAFLLRTAETWTG
ncbi:MAG: hypothetical protein ACKVT1_05790 [Dehalococcoidia bacterium]